MALTSTHDGQGNVILYGGTATHDNMGNVVLTVAATEGGTAIAEDEVSLSLVDTSGYAEHEEVEEAAKTATDYIDFDEGLIVGDLREDGKVGNNVFIDSDSVNIRNDKTVLAKFAAKLIELGKNATDAVINLCGGVGKIWAMEGQYQSQKRLNLSGGDTLGIYGPYAVDVRTNSNDFEDSTNATSEAYLALSSVLTFSQERVATAYLRAKWTESGINEDAALQLYSKEGTAYAQLSAADNFMTLYEDRTEFSAKVQSTAETTPFRHIHPTTGRSVGFGVGSGGSYAGLYDFDKNGWVMRFDQSDLSLRGPSGLYKPYFTAGDTFSVTIRTAGYCTSSKSQVQYCIPLGKPVIGVSSVSVTTDADGGYKLRQDGNYTHGSGQSTYMRPNSHSVTYSPQGMVFAIATFGNTTNAVNNDAIGIEAVINVTFNA